MKTLKLIFREAGMLVAFVVLGSLLLLSYWITSNVDRSILAEYGNTSVSVILKNDSVQEFKSMLEKDSNILRYKIMDASENRERLRDLYPELSSVLSPLDKSFFPVSATVSVNNGERFLSRIESNPGVVSSHILHKPPQQLSRFLNIATFVFTGLWVLTLVLVLYFQLERLSYVQLRRWSLLKMLGQKPLKIFWPICFGQLARVGVASVLALSLASLVAGEFLQVFSWQWAEISFLTWMTFIGVSLSLAVFVFMGLFLLRFRRVSLG